LHRKKYEMKLQAIDRVIDEVLSCNLYMFLDTIVYLMSNNCPPETFELFIDDSTVPTDSELDLFCYETIPLDDAMD